MIKQLCLLLLLVSSTLIAAPRVAIIGTGDAANDLADLVVSELSGEIELVEREKINAILAERDIVALSADGVAAASWPVDLFAIIENIERDGEAIPSRVIVFEASSGLQLIYTILPEDFNHALTVATAELRRALGMHASGDFTVLSLLAVRSDVPRTGETVGLEAEIRRRLPTIPGVVVAERDHTTRLLTEHRLGHALNVPNISNYMIELEFTPDPAPNGSFRTTIRILSIDGTTLLRKEFAGAERAAPQPMIAAISEFLETTPPGEPCDINEEARRYFHEGIYYIALGNHELGFDRFETAITMSFDSVRYRLWMVSHYVPYFYAAPREQRSAIWFPTIKKLGVMQGELNTFSSRYDNSMLDVIFTMVNQVWNEGSQEQKEELVTLVAELRPQWREKIEACSLEQENAATMATYYGRLANRAMFFAEDEYLTESLRLMKQLASELQRFEGDWEGDKDSLVDIGDISKHAPRWTQAPNKISLAELRDLRDAFKACNTPYTDMAAINIELNTIRLLPEDERNAVARGAILVSSQS